MKYNEDTMWQATIDCDKKYDSEFFYAVKTVGVYCRPSCKSRAPLRKNICFFETKQDAENSGFRPCKRCHPDLLEYDPALKLAKHTKELIDKYFYERKQLTLEMKQLGVSANHLTAIFRQQYGLSPIGYLNKMRSEHAKILLAQTNTPIIDVAFDIGFESLSAFYVFFKKHTGTTPRDYRTCVEKDK